MEAPEWMPISKEQLEMMFAASCIEWAAEELGCDYLEIFERMDRVGLIDDYIVKCYNVLHTESREAVTADILETLKIWEEKAK